MNFYDREYAPRHSPTRIALLFPGPGAGTSFIFKTPGSQWSAERYQLAPAGDSSYQEISCGCTEEGGRIHRCSPCLSASLTTAHLEGLQLSDDLWCANARALLRTSISNVLMNSSSGWQRRAGDLRWIGAAKRKTARSDGSADDFHLEISRQYHLLDTLHRANWYTR